MKRQYPVRKRKEARRRRTRRVTRALVRRERNRFGCITLRMNISLLCVFHLSFSPRITGTVGLLTDSFLPIFGQLSIPCTVTSPFHSLLISVSTTQASLHTQTFSYTSSPTPNSEGRAADSFGVETRGQMMLLEWGKFKGVVEGLEGFVTGGLA